MNEEKTTKDKKSCYSTESMRVRPRSFIIIFLIVFLTLLIGNIFSYCISENEGNYLYIIGIIAELIGLSIPIYWWRRIIKTHLELKEEVIIATKGILSKKTHEIFLSDIKSLEINQTLMQRILGIGDVEILEARQKKMDINIHDIAGPYKLQECIEKYHKQYLQKN